jgi:hypothetical protein
VSKLKRNLTTIATIGLIIFSAAILSQMMLVTLFFAEYPMKLIVAILSAVITFDVFFLTLVHHVDRLLLIKQELATAEAYKDSLQKLLRIDQSYEKYYSDHTYLAQLMYALEIELGLSRHGGEETGG